MMGVNFLKRKGAMKMEMTKEEKYSLYAGTYVWNTRNNYLGKIIYIDDVPCGDGEKVKRILVEFHPEKVSHKVEAFSEDELTKMMVGDKTNQGEIVRVCPSGIGVIDFGGCCILPKNDVLELLEKEPPEEKTYPLGVYRVRFMHCEPYFVLLYVHGKKIGSVSLKECWLFSPPLHIDLTDDRRIPQEGMDRIFTENYKYEFVGSMSECMNIEP